MIFSFSGGSPIVECNLEAPAIMLSAYVNVNKSGKPDSRLRRLMKVRRLAKKGKKK